MRGHSCRCCFRFWAKQNAWEGHETGPGPEASYRARMLPVKVWDATWRPTRGIQPAALYLALRRQ